MIVLSLAFMPRLNISLPDDVYALATRWRGARNLSEICARALRDELAAAESRREIGGLLAALRPPSELERALARRHALADVVVCEVAGDARELRDVLGREAALYLGRHLASGARLAIAGGRQMWCAVRCLTPRDIRVTITALGIRQHDPRVLHAHPNTLTTLLWLLYGPRAQAHLVGARAFAACWAELPRAETPRYLVAASCAPLATEGPFAELLGAGARRALADAGAVGDFAYQFLDASGGVVEAPLGGEHSVLPAPTLKALARRDDARVVAVAGGGAKLEILRLALAARLCNVLITDTGSAKRLLD